MVAMMEELQRESSEAQEAELLLLDTSGNPNNSIEVCIELEEITLPYFTLYTTLLKRP
jgi:hypothetical protein